MNAAPLPDQTTLKAYVPASWFHPVGVLKVLNRFWDRLPDVSGKLFITFTVDPKLFGNEETAFDLSRDRLRRMFYQLRKGVVHKGKCYVIDAPYCVKVEFHESGWVHYHVIFLTRRFVPGAMLTKLWDFGRVQIERITNKDFHYLLKYVTKAGDLPGWVKTRKRLRVFQTTKGFLRKLPEVEGPQPEEAVAELKPKLRRASYTISERLDRWERMAVLRHGKRFATVLFLRPFRELFDHLVLSVALDGRYNGNGEIVIKQKKDMIPWIQMQKQLARPTS